MKDMVKKVTHIGFIVRITGSFGCQYGGTAYYKIGTSSWNISYNYKTTINQSSKGQLIPKIKEIEANIIKYIDADIEMKEELVKLLDFEFEESKY
jgi:hypothetical protein